MSISILVDPPDIIPWLSLEEREANIILLDFDADIIMGDVTKIDRNIVFNPKPVRRGIAIRADYYVGTTGAEITLRTNGGNIQTHTESVKLDVNWLEWDALLKFNNFFQLNF